MKQSSQMKIIKSYFRGQIDVKVYCFIVVSRHSKNVTSV